MTARGRTGVDDTTETAPTPSAVTTATAVDATGAAPHVPTARRDFALLWAGQSTSLVGAQFMVVALPLLAVMTLGATPAEAALLPFAQFGPFLVLGLPAGAIVDRLRRRTVMVAADGVQALCFLTVALLSSLRLLTFGEMLGLVMAAGCASVFFQVAYTSYLPVLFTDPKLLHKGNARLFVSESVARAVGPALAGVITRAVGAVWAVASTAITFGVSVTTLAAIRHREKPSEGPPTTDPGPAAERRSLSTEVRAGLRFVFGHDQLEPVILCGSVYVLFLTMVEASLVLYCLRVLGLDAAGVGLVVGAAAAGYPLGNLLSGRLIERYGLARTLVIGAVVSVSGIVAMPVAGSLGSTVGLILGSVVHTIGEGAFGPTSLTLRQTASPPELMARVNSVQRFLIWGMIPLGSLLAAGAIAVSGLTAAVWIGAIGTIGCLPVLYRRGIRTQARARAAATVS
jgi:MFS family permease